MNNIFSWMLFYLVLTSVTFSLIGFIIGVWADGFEKLQVVPLLIITPLTFLGGSFYSNEDVNLWVSLGMTLGFLGFSIAAVMWIFKTGYRLKK
jgi:ABC-2 type transport system permease protein